MDPIGYKHETTDKTIEYLNPPTKRVTLNCMRTQQLFKMPLEQDGTLSMDRLKEFVNDAIGIRYKNRIFDRYVVLPPNINGFIEPPEEGWEGLLLEICYRNITNLKDTLFPDNRSVNNFSFLNGDKNELGESSEERKFLCDQCPGAYKDRKTLRRHIQRIHDKALHYECQECNKKFFQSSELKRHIKTVHEKSVSVSCERCGKIFSHKNSLLKHRRLPICPRLKKIYEVESIVNVSICEL
uniref:C2H2-type domain-containing protein n=1 Tax=Acrobeloides nanus TaxID=290746 RepID=A0A914C8Y4_9BILA